MAFYDVIRFEGVSSDWILYKHPVDEFNNGSRLIVSIGQVAIIAHNGVIEKILIDGSYKINSELLPILKSFTKKFFGGHNPYPIEIYFINKRLKLDFLWGTSEPIKMFDPIYHIEINIRARGQLGIRISDYQFFLQTLIGSLLKDNYITFDVLKNYFKGIINEKVKQEITRFMLSKKVSIFEITAHLDEIKSNFFKILKEEFYKYGFDLVNLSIESIGIPDEDSKKLNEILLSKNEFEILGDLNYRTKRGYDVLENAASNENGSASLLMGIGAGGLINKQLDNGIIPSEKSEIKNEHNDADIVCPKCGTKIKQASKFCSECGTKILSECPACHTSVSVKDKFCPECGEQLYK